MKLNRKTIILIAGALMMLCAGILYMWSVFQPHVTSNYGWSSAQVSMTSAVMVTCFVFGNIIGGSLKLKISPRIISLMGAVLFSGGLLSTGLYLAGGVSYGSPAVLYLTYGVFGGLGSGFIYSTVLAVLQKWYAAKIGLITGICVGFFGLSVVVMPPLTEALISGYGLPVTFKILAAAFFVILTASAMTMKDPSPEYYYAEAVKAERLENIKQFTPGEMLRSASFYYIIISMFASSAAYLVIVPLISTIAVSRGMSHSLALFSVMITGVANSAGRILAPAASSKIGRSSTIMLCSLISAVGCVLMVTASGILYIAAVFLIAFSYGGTSGTNSVITTELFGVRHSGTNYGLVLLSIAFSSLFFGQLSMSLSGDGLSVIFIICAAACAVPVIMMLLLKNRCIKTGKKI